MRTPYWVTLHPDGLLELSYDRPQLEDLQRAVGGYVEAIGGPHGETVYVNEEGKLNGLAVNAAATAYCRTLPRDVLVGPAVFVGGPDDNGDDTPLTDEQFRQLMSALAA